MKYCKLASCEHFKGGTIQMFQIPKDVELRDLWQSALCEQICSRSNLICIEHFHRDDYTNNGKLFKLKKCAVPTIFKNTIDVECVSRNTGENEESNPVDIAESKKIINTLEQQIETQSAHIKNLEKKISCRSSLSQFALNAACSNDQKVYD